MTRTNLTMFDVRLAGPHFRSAIDAMVNKLSDHDTSLDTLEASAGATEAVSVRAAPYLATGNGTTDDRDAINAAITAAVAAGKNVYFPAGTYKISKYLLVDGASGIRLYGPGTILHPSDDVTVVADSVALSDAPARSGIYLNYCSNVTVEGLTFRGGNDARLSTVNVGNSVSARHCVGTKIIGVTGRLGGALFQQDAQSNTTGAGDVLAVAGGVVTLADSTGQFKPGHLGRWITLSGTTNSANSGTFLITGYTSASQITYSNAGGVTETSSFTWTVDDEDRGTLISECRSELQRTPITTGNDSSVINTRIERGRGFDDCGIGESLALSGSTVTLTDRGGRFKPAYHNKIVNISSSTSAANNGTFRLTYISPTQISWTNASGVTEPFTGNWWVINGDQVGFGAGTSAISATAGTVTLTSSTAVFNPSDVNKPIRVAFATTTANNGAFVITEVVSSTKVKFLNSSGVSETFSGVWSIDGYARSATGSETVGSTHGIYIFAGRTNILVQGCSFVGIATTCVKASGSSAPIRNVVVKDCFAYECAEFFNAGADDINEHTGLVCTDNTVIDVGTGSLGRRTGLCVSVLGSRGTRVSNNHFHYTRNNIAQLETGSLAGMFVVQASGGDGAQPVEDISVCGNKFTADSVSVSNAGIANTVISLTNIGQTGKQGIGTLTKSGSTITLTSGSNLFSAQDVGKTIRIRLAPDAGNNGTFVVTDVTSTTTCTYINASGVGGGVSAGTWFLDGKAGWLGACKVSDNEIGPIGEVSVYTTNCVGPEITDNILVNGAIYLSGDVHPRVYGNRQLSTNTQTSQIRLFPGTSWPTIDNNYVTNQRASTVSGWDFSIGDSSGNDYDFPLLGRRGRAVPTQGKPEVVVSYGSKHVDGDTITVNGSTFTYKAVSPGVNQFNSKAGLISLIDALATIACVDYGTPWSITTDHLKINSESASTTADLFSVTTSTASPTALVMLPNTISPHTTAASRGQATGGPVLDKTVVWSPLCSQVGGVALVANNAAAKTILAGSFYTVKSSLNAGSCEVLLHNATGGTEDFRWTIF